MAKKMDLPKITYSRPFYIMIVLHSAHVHNSYSDEERRRRNTSKKEKEKEVL